jgi:hypothetical protein
MRNTEDNTKAAVPVSAASAAFIRAGGCVARERNIYGSVVQPHGGGEPVIGQLTVVGSLT